MPVRTNRGRVAVYRKIWGWPLRSTRHLVATALALITLGTAIAAAGTALSTEEQTRTAPSFAPTTVTTAAPTTRTPTTTNRAITSTTATAAVTPAPSGTPADQVKAAVAVAGEFMARWVTHPAGMSSAEWAAQLAPYVVPEYLVTLETVDPATITAIVVTGAPAVTAATPPGSPTVVEVDVATDTATVHLVLLAQPDRRWLVRSYDLKEDR